MGRYYPGGFSVIPPDTLYFVTITVIDWVDVFTRDEYKRIVISSLDYCRRHKGLVIYAFVLMTNHLHLIVSHDDGKEGLSKVFRDFKKYTSRAVIAAIKDNPQESRRQWLLKHFDENNIKANQDASCSVSKSRHPTHKKNYHLWQRGYDAYCICNIRHLRQKVDYLHENPVRAGIVAKPWEYLYSSFSNYCGNDPILEVDFLDLGIEDPTKPIKTW